MNREISEHLLVLRRWIDQQGHIPKLASGLSVEEQKQLQAVNKAVEQLSRSGVAVPEDLRSLKLKLSAKDVSGSENREIKIRLKEVETLIEQLGKILKSARSIRGRLKAVGQPGGPKKHYGVTLLDLLQDGLISAEDRFELKWLKDGPTHEGKVKPDGTVMAKETGGWKQYASLSTAVSKIAERSLNGWKHWRRVNSDGTFTAMEAIRERFMNEETG